VRVLTPAQLICVTAFLFSLIAGCVYQPLLSTEYKVADELISAESAMNAGQYHLARMKYAMVLEERPRNETALFGLGLSHFRLGAYENAAIYLNRYIEDFPKGRYAGEAHRYATRIDSIQQERIAERTRRIEQLRVRLADAQEAVERRPDDPNLRVELGNAYWDMAEFDNAAEQYQVAVKLDSRMKFHAAVRHRIEFGPRDSVTVLTPQELERRDREANPIVVENTRGYRAGRSAFDFQHLWYVVSGQVRNRSSGRVLDVAVETTIFDFSGHVLDTKQTYIGAIPADGVRSFSARLTNFDDINNVYRYECYVLYR